jgi:RNA polymerase sigma-32 factor
MATEREPKRTPNDLLDRETERELIARYRDDDDVAALERLVAEHLPLVRSTVARYRRRGASLDDLVAEGRLGLIEAAGRFEPARGVRFATYAAWWVRAYVRRYALGNLRIVGAPNTRAGRRIVGKLPAARRVLAQRLGREPTRDELAAHLDATAADVAMVTAAFSGRDVPMDAHLEERWRDRTGPNPEQFLREKQEAEVVSRRVERAMGELTARERLIVEKRLMQDERMTLARLGTALGVSRERVRQLEKRARDKLRHALRDVA